MVTFFDNFMKGQLATWRITFSRWEFLPAWIAKVPVFAFWLYFSAKARHFFFFNVVNPTIENGGMMNESKIRINLQLPLAFIPTTVYCAPNLPLSVVRQKLQAAAITYPLIAKPDVGGRGRLVALIPDEAALAAHLQHPEAFMLQHYETLPMELSVLYVRFPGQPKGFIQSLCEKKMLTVTGDGRRTLQSLIFDYPRAKLQWERLRETLGETANSIPAAGAEVLLEPIGNHCRGSKFINRNHLISPALTSAFDRLNALTPDMHFVRYDLKCQDWESLCRLEQLKILEINGVGAEPAHIYDPTNRVVENYKDLYQHWKTIYQIAQLQHARGYAYMTWAQVKEMFSGYPLPPLESPSDYADSHTQSISAIR